MWHLGSSVCFLFTSSSFLWEKNGLMFCGIRTNSKSRCSCLLSKRELWRLSEESFVQLRFLLLPGASEKASCSSLAKSRTSPQGPWVGVYSPAALCACAIIWIEAHKGREKKGFIFPYIHHEPPLNELKCCISQIASVFGIAQFSCRLPILIQSGMGTNTLPSYSRMSTHTNMHKGEQRRNIWPCLLGSVSVCNRGRMVDGSSFRRPL